MRVFRALILCVVLALMIGTALPLQAQEQPYFPATEGWRTSTPEAQGFDSAKLARFLDYLESKSTDSFHSLVVIRHGFIVLDASLSPFSSLKPQAFRESAESVLATLIGIAIDKGLIKGVDQSIWDFLPKDKIASMDADKASLTIKHFLTHQSGLSFNEDQDFEKYYPLGAADASWLQVFLDSKMITRPGTGTAWLYGDGLVLSAVLQQATGMTALEFARQNLFGPLRISDVTWLADPQGITIGTDELYMSPHDMARIAYLYLHHGQWQGNQIVSEGWVQAATSKIVAFPSDSELDGAGYGWNIARHGEAPVFLQYSMGGEQFAVYPDLDLIYLITGDSSFSLPGMFDIFLAPSDESAALPENAEAFAKLNAKIETLAHPAPRELVALPAALKAASGKTFTLDQNLLGWQTLTVDFGAPSPNEATLTLGIDGQNVQLTTGLDFVDRITPVGLPAQPASGAYRLLGDLPWKAKTTLAENQMHVWMGDLMGREDWSVTLGFTADNQVSVDAVMTGLSMKPENWSFNGTAK